MICLTLIKAPLSRDELMIRDTELKEMGPVLRRVLPFVRSSLIE